MNILQFLTNLILSVLMIALLYNIVEVLHRAWGKFKEYRLRQSYC
jgi:hypothetical protein